MKDFPKAWRTIAQDHFDKQSLCPWKKNIFKKGGVVQDFGTKLHFPWIWLWMSSLKLGLSLLPGN